MKPNNDTRTSRREVVPEGIPGRGKAERVQTMFRRIVPRYDLMNALMSGGMDRYWRATTAREIAPAGWRVLDVGTGTGDLAIAIARAGARSIVGADFCEEMVVAAQEKVRKSVALKRTPTFLAADALHLPFPDQSFDRVVNGFLLRNVADLPAALAEMTRVLKPGGQLACLEITHPPAALAPFFHLYFHQIVPLIGALVTGEGAAYRYLPASLGPLPNAHRLAGMLAEAGLTEIRYRRLGFGTVALHLGTRPA